MAVYIIKKEDAPLDTPADVGIVLEGTIVISVIGDTARACSRLFGLIYAINLSYPKEVKYFFEVLQKVFMGLNQAKISPKVQALQNSLLRIKTE